MFYWETVYKSYLFEYFIKKMDYLEKMTWRKIVIAILYINHILKQKFKMSFNFVKWFWYSSFKWG